MKKWTTLKKLIWLKMMGTIGGSAVEKTVKGAIVHITDALARPAISVKCEINPVQDLHGYDNPWPAGGGQNILDPNLRFTAGTYYGGAVIATSDGYNITLSGTPTESGNITTNNIPTSDAIVMPAGTYTSVGAIFSTYKADGSWYTNRQVGTWTADEPFIIRQAYIQAVAGTPLSGSRFIALAKGSTAPTAWTPYSNICPISGFTGVRLERDGGNTIDTSTNQSGAIDENGNEVANASINRTDYIPVTGATGTLKMTIASGYNIRIHGYNSSKAWVEQIKVISTTGADVFDTFTIPSGIAYIRISYPLAAVNTTEFWQGTTYTQTFTDSLGNTLTVYGGETELVSGKLTVTKGLKEFDGSEDEGWAKNTTYNYFVTSKITDAKDENAKRENFQSNLYAYGNIANANQDLGACLIWGAVRVRLADMSLSLTEWTASLAETPLQVLYPLATPIFYDLDPVTVNLLLGENNLWHDANGDTELTYYADGRANTQEALGILLGGTYHNPGGADDVPDDEALQILLGGS